MGALVPFMVANALTRRLGIASGLIFAYFTGADLLCRGTGSIAILESSSELHKILMLEIFDN